MKRGVYFRATLILVCVWLMLSGCSRTDFGVRALSEGSCSLRAAGNWQGTEIEASIYCNAESGDLSISFLSGSLFGITLTRSAGEIRISRVGVEERDFYFGGLCTLACLFIPDSLELSGVEREGEARVGVLSARSGELSYQLRTTEEGVPLSVYGEGFYLSVTDYKRQ